jgi:hypothetical protein
VIALAILQEYEHRVLPVKPPEDVKLSQKSSLEDLNLNADISSCSTEDQNKGSDLTTAGNGSIGTSPSRVKRHCKRKVNGVDADWTFEVEIPTKKSRRVRGSCRTASRGIVKSRDAPDTVFAGYPANPKAVYRISGKGRIPDIQPDIRPILGLTTKCLVKYKINL